MYVLLVSVINWCTSNKIKCCLNCLVNRWASNHLKRHMKDLTHRNSVFHNPPVCPDPYPAASWSSMWTFMSKQYDHFFLRWVSPGWVRTDYSPSLIKRQTHVILQPESAEYKYWLDKSTPDHPQRGAEQPRRWKALPYTIVGSTSASVQVRDTTWTMFHPQFLFVTTDIWQYTIQRSRIPGFASLVLHARTHIRTQERTHEPENPHERTDALMHTCTHARTARNLLLFELLQCGKKHSENVRCLTRPSGPYEVSAKPLTRSDRRTLPGRLSKKEKVEKVGNKKGKGKMRGDRGRKKEKKRKRTKKKKRSEKRVKNEKRGGEELCFSPHFPFLLSYFFYFFFFGCVFVCVCVSSYVCACVFGNSMCVGQW